MSSRRFVDGSKRLEGCDIKREWEPEYIDKLPPEVEKGKGTNFPLRPPEGASPANTLVFGSIRLIADLWPPE